MSVPPSECPRKATRNPARASTKRPHRRLRASLAALPQLHTKAQAVLTLALAEAALQADNLKLAVELTRHALATTRHQPIMPIPHQARRVRRLIQQYNPAAGSDLADELNGFAHVLTAVAASAQR